MAETEKKKKPQRNALRSQKLIKKAFAKLLHEKELNKITVSDVVKEAEICRGTFYAHYIDINDLYDQMEREIVDEVVQFIDELGVINFLENPRSTLEFAFSVVGKDKDFYRNLLLNKSALVIAEKLINMLRDRFVDEITATYHEKSKDETKAFLIFIANGAQGMFTRWLNESAPLATDKTVEVICNMLCGCREAFLNEDLK